MIEKLEMFIALARERHFGRAAEACGVTQPTLSSAIRQLEDGLGVQLVFRGSRFHGLTPEGERVLDWARRIVGDARTMREEMRTARKGLSGRLRLGVIPTALPMVADLTAPFVARHPNVRVTVLSRTSADIVAGIETLELDAGITYLSNEPLGRMVGVPLYEESYRLLCAAGHPFAGRASVTWAELRDQPLCLLTGDMQNRRIIDAQLGGTAPSVEANSTIVLASHVMTGRWVSIVPARMAGFFLPVGGLAAVPILPEITHSVGLIAAEREPHIPVLAELLDLARRR